MFAKYIHIYIYLLWVRANWLKTEGERYRRHMGPCDDGSTLEGAVANRTVVQMTRFLFLILEIEGEGMRALEEQEKIIMR